MTLTTVNPALLDTQAQYTGFKNRIINGAMVIDQRNAGASGTADGYTIDRFAYYGVQASKGTWQQNAGAVTPPTGFTNYLGFTSSSAYSVLAGDLFEFYQFIEGYNFADLKWGTANAATVTLSFLVRSSLTGTFGAGLTNSGNTRNYPFTYTISSANTWEQKSITIAGDTSGTWLTTNGRGVGLVFNLGAGSDFSTTANAWNGTTSKFMPTGAVSVVGTNAATWYVTGVQLEKGSTATSFDYRPYGTELGLCQRYYQTRAGYNCMMGSRYGANLLFVSYSLPVVMRTTPTVSNGNGWSALNSSGTESGSALTINSTLTSTGGNIDVVINSSFNPAVFVYFMDHSSTTVPTLFSAEL